MFKKKHNTEKKKDSTGFKNSIYYVALITKLTHVHFNNNYRDIYFIKHLSYVRHCASNFTCILSLGLYNNVMGEVCYYLYFTDMKTEAKNKK